MVSQRLLLWLAPLLIAVLFAPVAYGCQGCPAPGTPSLEEPGRGEQLNTSNVLDDASSETRTGGPWSFEAPNIAEGIGTKRLVSSDGSVEISYPTNDSGQTFGITPEVICSDAIVSEEIPAGVDWRSLYPDLVRVASDEGLDGYAYRDDFLWPLPSNPEEALAMQDEGAFVHQVAVYEDDGHTQIGLLTDGDPLLAQLLY